MEHNVVHNALASTCVQCTRVSKIVESTIKGHGKNPETAMVERNTLLSMSSRCVVTEWGTAHFTPDLPFWTSFVLVGSSTTSDCKQKHPRFVSLRSTLALSTREGRKQKGRIGTVTHLTNVNKHLSSIWNQFCFDHIAWIWIDKLHIVALLCLHLGNL